MNSPLALTDQGHRLDLDRLERDFASGARVYLLCSPQNPTGLVFDRDELEAVADLADRYGVRVVVDEIHAPLTYPGVRHVPFASLDRPAAARSITLVSASKAWNLAGLKAAMAVAGPAARADVAAIHPEISEAAGLFGVIASEAALTEGEPWLAELLVQLDATAGCSASCWPSTCRRSATGCPGPPTWPGWTAGTWVSATTRRPPSWSAAGSRCNPARGSGRPVTGSPGSTSPPRPSTSPRRCTGWPGLAEPAETVGHWRPHPVEVDA